MDGWPSYFLSNCTCSSVPGDKGDIKYFGLVIIFAVILFYTNLYNSSVCRYCSNGCCRSFSFAVIPFCPVVPSVTVIVWLIVTLTSRCHAAATTASAAFLPLHCRHRAVRCRWCCSRRRATAKLPQTLRCSTVATATATATAPLFVGWLLPCCPPSNFVISCHHATVNALVASRFCQELSSTAATAATTATTTTATTTATAATAAAAGPPPPPPPPPWQNHCHTWTKNEAAATTPPAYQLLHHQENVYKSRQLGLV